MEPLRGRANPLSSQICLLGVFPNLEPKQSPYASDGQNGSKTGTCPLLLSRGEQKSDVVIAYPRPSANRPSFISEHLALKRSRTKTRELMKAAHIISPINVPHKHLLKLKQIES